MCSSNKASVRPVLVMKKYMQALICMVLSSDSEYISGRVQTIMKTECPGLLSEQYLNYLWSKIMGRPNGHLL